MNRRGVFDVARKTIFWMIIAFVISVLIVAFSFLIAGYQNKLTSFPTEVKADLISLRFINNPDCFAYKDEVLDRVYVGSIDLSKFTQERLDSCYKTDEELGHREINFRLSIVDVSAENLVTNNYFNIDHYRLPKDVLIWNGERIEKGRLDVYVQDPLPRRPADSLAGIQGRRIAKEIENVNIRCLGCK